ncbi:MAG: hypothetical protein WC341_00405 [Bacteroidales bacterium]
MEGDLSDFEEAWKYFVWMQATDWKLLPTTGGLEDQDNLLMNNIFKIASFVQKLKKAKKPNG